MKPFVLFCLAVYLVSLASCGGIIEDRKKQEEEFMKKTQGEQVTILIKNIAKTYNNLVSVFQTNKTTQYVTTYISNGFDSLDQTATGLVLIGVKESRLDSKIYQILDSLNLDEDVADYAVLAVGDSKGQSKSKYSNNDIMFKAGKDSKASYVQIVVQSNPRFDELSDYTYNIYVGHVVSNFKFEDNMEVIQKTDSYVGAVYTESEYYIEEKPKKMSKDELNNLLKLYRAICYRQILVSLGESKLAPEFKI